MAKAKKTSQSQRNESAILGYEAQLWQMADALRGSLDAAEYEHVLLGLVFLKCISDTWQYRVPPLGDAKFASVQHIAHHLALTGVAGFVLANGSLSSNQSGEGKIQNRAP